MKRWGLAVVTILIWNTAVVAVPLWRKALQPNSASVQSEAQADGVSTCSCDCCTAEFAREDEANAGVVATETKLQCGVSPNDGNPNCASLCHRPAGDQVLSTAEGQEVDLQRFCFFECEPIPQHGPDAPLNASPAPGDNCGPLSKNEAALVRDSNGNPRPPMEVPKLMTHFLMVKRTVKSAAGTSSNAFASVAAPAPAAAGQPTWSTVGKEAMAQSAQVVKWAQEAQAAANEAEVAATDTVNAATTAGAAMVASYKAMQDAKTAAESAEEAEERVHAIFVGFQSRARQAALSAVNDTYKEMETYEMDKAQKEAAEAQRIAQEEMEVEAPKAADQAMVPYEQSMQSQSQLADQYMVMGDELATKAQSMQMSSQEAHSQANGYLSLGMTDQAQKQLLKAKEMMADSTELNKKANAYYATAQSITNNIPYWYQAAQQAAYHAEVLVNPDTPTPSPPLVSPLVLVQRPSLRKRLLLRARAARQMRLDSSAK